MAACSGCRPWFCAVRNTWGRFPSGQRGQTVNLLAKPSKVRILLSPGAFFFQRKKAFSFLCPVSGEEGNVMGVKFSNDGLRFECTRCSECCRHTPGYVFLSSKDLDDPRRRHSGFGGRSSLKLLSPSRSGLARRISLKEKANLDCIFWENGGCSRYEARPLQCRSFPFWSACVSSRRNGNSCPAMPGHGQGALCTRGARSSDWLRVANEGRLPRSLREKGGKMKVTFWGVRGSLPTPLSPEQVRSKIAAVVQRIRPVRS